MHQLASLLFILIGSSAVMAEDWPPLAEDGVHDPGNPVLDLLQEQRSRIFKADGGQIRAQIHHREILQAVKIIKQAAILIEIKRIDGQIPPRRILAPIIGKGHHRMAPVCFNVFT